MAHARGETSFLGELVQAKLFKPSQGRVVRQVTALTVAGTFLAMGWRLYATVLSDAASGARLGVSAGVAAFGCWLAFRLVNWPTFANFLISVEAEMDKVSWASWEYLKRATAVVLVTMVVLGAFLFSCDLIWQQFFFFIGFLDKASMGS